MISMPGGPSTKSGKIVTTIANPSDHLVCAKTSGLLVTLPAKTGSNSQILRPIVYAQAMLRRVGTILGTAKESENDDTE